MKIVKTILQLLLMAQFTFFGISKIIGSADMVATFTSFGFPSSIRILVGLVEVAAVLWLAYGFYNPKAVYIGVTLLFGLTIGAALCHLLLEGSVDNAIPPVIVLAQTAVMAWLHGQVKTNDQKVSLA